MPNVLVNGQTVAFPDGMSNDDIAAAIKKNALSIPKKEFDPSAGGSTLNVAGFDTGIKTSQGVDRFLAGAGKAVGDLGSGVQQIGAMMGIGDSAKVQDRVDEAKRLDKPLMDTGAGMAGNVSGNVAITLLPAGGIAKGAEGIGAARTALAAKSFINPTTYRSAAAAGGTMGAIQPVASDESRALNTGLGAVGGTLGQGVVNGLGRIAQPVQNALDPIRQAAVDKLKSVGVPLDLSQVTGSPAWQRIRSSLGDNIFTLGGQVAKDAEQKGAFTNAALGTIGASGKATSDVMGQAEGRINGVFKDVLDRNDVKPDPSWVTPLTDIQAKALENEKKPIATVINRIFDSVDPKTGTIPGQVAYGIKKDLDRMAMTPDSTQRYLALQAKSALMDGINGSLSGADQKAFAEARGQFANMKKLEGAIPTDGTGDISPAKLANILGQKANRGASVYGKGPQELVELAQAGKLVLGDKTPNSGTTARLMASLTPSLVGGVGGGVYGALSGDDFAGSMADAGKFAGGTFLAPKAMQMIMNSPKVSGLLSSGVQNDVLRGLLESPQNNVIAGQIARNIPAAGARNWLLPASQ